MIWQMQLLDPVILQNISFCSTNYYLEGLSIKDVRSQEGHTSDADICNFWCKSSSFSKFMVCPHGQGKGLIQCRHFADEGGLFFFFQFCADVFYGWSLMFPQTTALLSLFT